MDNFIQVLCDARKAAFGGLLFVTLVLLSSVGQAAHWQSSDYILESFDKITMRDSQLKKWQTPIYYQIAHHVDDIPLHEKLVATHLEQLQHITGLTIKPANALHKANMTIVLTTEQQFKTDVAHYFNLKDESKIERLAKNKIGVTSLLTNTQGYIQQSVVIIPTDRARAYGRLLTSFSEMLTRGLGMQYHSKDVFPSIFNGNSIDVFLTGLDYMMLKMLYDQRVTPSLEHAKLRQLLQSMLNEKRYQQDIYQATLAVRQSGLTKLIN